MNNRGLIFLSGGVGSRMGLDMPKQYLLLEEKPIVWYSFRLFLKTAHLKEVVVVAELTWHPLFEEIFEEEKQEGQKLSFARPGKERQDSVFNGLIKLSPEITLVAIHDGCRPLITQELIETAFEEGQSHGACAPSLPVTLTIKKTDNEQNVEKTLDRSALHEIQTPQVLHVDLLKKGFEKVKKEKIAVTDDLSIVEAIGHKPKLIKGLKKNIKITHPEDLEIARLYEKL